VRENVEEFTALDEQQRLQWIKNYLSQTWYVN
jgi:hypothetical protein